MKIQGAYRVHGNVTFYLFVLPKDAGAVMRLLEQDIKIGNQYQKR
jgi:hypothetical protein